jgi:hypothetical protein
MDRHGNSMEEAKDGVPEDLAAEMAEIERTGNLSQERMDILKEMTAKLHEFVMDGDRAKVAAITGLRNEVIRGSISVEKAQEDMAKI